jgi:hypothetical protein
MRKLHGYPDFFAPSGLWFGRRFARARCSLDLFNVCLSQSSRRSSCDAGDAALGISRSPGSGRGNLWLLRGLRRQGRVPRVEDSGPLLVSCKHQSLWETFAFFDLPDPAYIMKRERADPVLRLVS